MPRPTYPRRPGTGVFDPNWQFYHRPLAESQMTAVCVITRPASSAVGVYDEAAGKTVFPPATPLYNGPCRVQVVPQRSIGAGTVGERETVKRRYNVCVPASVTGLAVHDTLTVTVCDGDASLVGQPLWIADVTDGTQIWQRDLVCEELEPTTR
jgi:hypothetical protein